MNLAALLRRVPALHAIAAVAVLLIVWTLVTLAPAGERIVPSPGEVLEAMIGDLGVLPDNLAATLANASVGFLIGNAVAVTVAVLFVAVPLAERLLFRVTLLSACVPLVVITPIVVILLPGDLAKQGLAAVAVFFPTMIACMLGLRSSTGLAQDVVRSMGGGRVDVLLRTRLQAMLPYLFGGLQVAAPAAVVGAILAEYLGSSVGLGIMLVQAQSSFEIARTWSISLLMAVVSGAAYALIGVLGRAATPWVSKQVSLDAPPAARAGGGLLGAIGGLLFSLAIIVGLWWGGVLALDLDPYFAKTPLDVWQFLVTAPTAADERAVLLEGLGITLRDAVIGYLVGTAFACVLALAGVVSPTIGRMIAPLAVAVRAVPLVALVPVLTLTFGRDLLGVTVIVTLVTFFPAYVSVSRAMVEAPALAVDVVRSMGGGSARATSTVRLPYALPAILSSAKVALPLAIAGATLAEWMATGEGIGSMLVRDFATSRFGAVWAETVVIVGVSLLLYAVITIVEAATARRFGAGSVPARRPRTARKGRILA